MKCCLVYMKLYFKFLDILFKNWNVGNFLLVVEMEVVDEVSLVEEG